MHISVQITYALDVIFLWVLVMYMFVRMTIHFLLYGFSPCTFLYEWLSISFKWVFVMHISVRITIHFFLKGLSSWTFLYEWLSINFEWVFVMHISVRMTTISFGMDCRHAHFCTNYYHFVVYGFSSCTFCANDVPYSFCMDFRHAHFCANGFPYSFGFPCVQRSSTREYQGTVTNYKRSYNVYWFWPSA